MFFSTDLSSIFSPEVEFSDCVGNRECEVLYFSLLNYVMSFLTFPTFLSPIFL